MGEEDPALEGPPPEVALTAAVIAWMGARAIGIRVKVQRRETDPELGPVLGAGDGNTATLSGPSGAEYERTDNPFIQYKGGRGSGVEALLH